MLSTGAEARSLLDLLKPPTQHQEHVSRSGSVSQNAALELYTNKQKQASFDGCAELFPAAKPINMATVPATMKPLALCSDNFAVLFYPLVNSVDGKKMRMWVVTDLYGLGFISQSPSGNNEIFIRQLAQV